MILLSRWQFIVMYVCMVPVDGSIILQPPNGSVSHGNSYTFTLQVSQTDIRRHGLLHFKKDNISRPRCSVMIRTEMLKTRVSRHVCRVGGKAGSYFLRISRVNKNDSGTWYCQYGRTLSNKVRLDVKYPPTIRIHPVAPCKVFVYSVQEENISLNCTVISANPAPSTFRWYHNNRLIGESQMYVTPTVKRSTEGLYRCEADNGEAAHGEDTVSLNVQYPPVITVPRQTFIVNESRDLDIACTADANPDVASVDWTKKGSNSLLPVTHGVLELRNTKMTDSGTYICTASNTLTLCDGRKRVEYRKAEVKVEVQSIPEEPSSFHVYNVDTRALSLSWKKGFSGGAVQSFTVEYRQNGGQWIRYPIILSEQDDPHLDLDGLEPSTAYEVRLKAQNVYGSSEYIYVNAKTNKVSAMDGHTVIVPIRGYTDVPPKHPNTDVPPKHPHTDAPPINSNTDAPPIESNTDIPPAHHSHTDVPLVNSHIDVPAINRHTDLTPINRHTDLTPINRHTDVPQMEGHEDVSPMNRHTDTPHMNPHTDVSPMNRHDDGPPKNCNEYVPPKDRQNNAHQMDRFAVLGTGVGLGIALMVGIVFASLTMVFIFRKRMALCLTGSSAEQETTGNQMAEFDSVRAVENEDEEGHYDMPGDGYEDLGERTPEPPKAYEEIRNLST